MIKKLFTDRLDKACDMLNDNLQEIADSLDSQGAKWEFLYHYSRQSVDEEISRYQLLDGKAIKLLTSTSFILTTFLALFKWFIIDASNEFSICVYIVSAFTFFFLITSMYYYFSSMKLMAAPRMPLNADTLTLFKEQELPTIYIAFYKSCLSCANKNHELNEKKAVAINKGYNFTAVTGIFFLILISGIFASKDNSLPQEKNFIKEISMTNKKTENGKKPTIPNFDVPEPALKLATNSKEKAKANTPTKGE